MSPGESLQHAGEEVSRRVTLARLILMFAEGVERQPAHAPSVSSDGVPLDEHFARTLARSLDARAAYVRLPFIDHLGLEDVVVTLYMDRDMRLVVTGNHPTSFGAISARWDEEHFPFVEVELLPEPAADPYTFATLDFSVRGKKATLLRPVAPWPEGQTVTLRALATIGGSVEYRALALGQERSVPADALALS